MENWVNIIFKKYKACLWKLDRFMENLDTLKAHLSKKINPAQFIN